MEFSFIKTISELEALADEWNSLLAESITNVPFLRHEYLSAWWQTRGGGEWENAELALVTARQDGILSGIAPLFLAHNPNGGSVLMLLGSIEISDYLDVIVRERDLAEFLPGLLDFLADSAPASWRCLDWFNLPEASASLAALQSAAERHGWEYKQESFRPVVSASLTGDFKSYLAGIDKKQRHEIRRKMRRAAEYDLPVRWYILEDETRLDGAMDDFLNLMSNDPEKASFLSPAMCLQMKNAARAAWRSGWLQLAFLEVDGQKAAGYLNFDYNGHIWVYNSGLDQRYLELSPGWVLLGHLLQWANEHGRTEFDFMRGDEAYKFKFGGVQRFVMHVQVKR
jgi:CelD/BcsL family acetyltransferase involved in cellulose biosynthesis